MRCCDRGAHIRERLTANRSDLSLQGGPNQHSTYKLRWTTRTNPSSPRLELQEPGQRHIVSRALRECHIRFSKQNRMHLICALGSSLHTYDRRRVNVSKDNT